MTFPKPPAQFQIAEISLTLWDRSEDKQILVLNIKDDGGGPFPVLDLGNSFGHREGQEHNQAGIASFDVDGLESLGKWARRLCAWVEAQEKKP
jgi:hypothetical protein